MTPRPLFALIAALLLALGGWLASGAIAQRVTETYTDAGEAQRALAKAQADGRAAASRAEKLEQRAREAGAVADKSAQEAAAIAARIQQEEAGIAAAQARVAIAGKERAALDARLAVRRGPLVRLTGALQKMAMRPLALSVFKPGSLRETVYLRAVLETTIPEVRKRTAALRGEIAHRDRIVAETEQALAALKTSELALSDRRRLLAAAESRQRVASRKASGDAAREAERALALAERARDLDTLVGQLDEAGTLRRKLAALPGPVLRPGQGGAVKVMEPSTVASATANPQARFQLPVVGRTVSGFGEAGVGGVRATGISLAPVDRAQVVAPAEGRVVFAGPYRGFDRIVIVEHPNGFTSVVTGLARADIAVGDELVAGAPLGIAGTGHTVVTFELRKGGEPVNPLDYVR
ncbi:peptidoglycan DD-metalloendopeptidase family protein [Tsuneonella flava]|uniref:Peptidoglycan DD-metalloendopeptidase family protein n=1 Tax=Tsuneonella flava TaxID=2055955 RepID=A0ABX7KAZ4_9SPHN|nr:peptidoglycan DD-metalloendopeptidase family protein [Tsuneonella flava]QSB45043.1 peptidoglycan DD-metalloendopeptidase family protein [Tsuneonella flava]